MRWRQGHDNQLGAGRGEGRGVGGGPRRVSGEPHLGGKQDVIGVSAGFRAVLAENLPGTG